MSETGVDDPLLGKVLSGRFHIVEAIGAGGMGRVYKAVQRPLDRIVALKVLNPRYPGAKDPGFERRFFLEASMTAKLKHPNTITVHDYGRSDEGIYFIAMEYLEGETLQQALAREGALPWQRVLTIAAQMVRSLREAHRLGLVHRDLKPANVMLLSEATGGDMVKVLDFGLVKALSSEQAAQADSELTKAGVLLGSPLYMAPEQAKAETDQRSDIYSLGALLFHCLAGRPPFEGREAIALIVKHVRERPPELSAVAPHVPPEVSALVMRCLEKSPERRFQTMDELLEAIRGPLSGQSLSGLFAVPRSGPNPVGPATTPPPARPRGLARPPSTLAEPTEDTVLDAPRPAAELPTLDAERTEPGTHPGEAPARRRRSSFAALAAGVVALAVAGGAAVGLLTAASSRPDPLRPASPEVTFAVDSEPPGATVTRDGQVLGTTPLSFTVERSGDAPATVELAFALEGYRSTTVVAEGLGGTVPLRPVLVRHPAPPAP
ncbi:MAG: serine/threonine protein kinase [Myxococcaceae bacterium]|jgi:serine/threonine protein kinase|nr:serine/threonine protein kinase [Myxococcaceae bacterium]MCA3014441.1 serine/threonine protein kinase [Myxococcaceae bacterium]